jgi:hypothetical protein
MGKFGLHFRQLQLVLMQSWLQTKQLYILNKQLQLFFQGKPNTDQATQE